MPQPSAFYKYLSPQAAEAVLNSGRLRWSSPLEFDDPAEFRRLPRFDPSLEQVGRDAAGILFEVAIQTRIVDEARLCPKARKLILAIRLLVASGRGRESILQGLGTVGEGADDCFERELRRFVEAMVEDARVLCVTVDPDNDVLWEQYAEDRRGAMLEFRHLPEYSTPLLAAKPVTYASDLPIVGSGVDLLLFGDTGELRERCLESIVYTKKGTTPFIRQSWPR